VNEKKTRVQRPGRRQTITGIVVNKRPNVPRRVTKRLRAILHHAQKEGLAAQNRDERDNFEHWLGGMISYVQMLNPDKGERLHEAHSNPFRIDAAYLVSVASAAISLTVLRFDFYKRLSGQPR
jgi:hypothetical protein